MPDKPTFQDIIRSKSLNKNVDQSSPSTSAPSQTQTQEKHEKKEEKTWYAPVEDKFTVTHTDPVHSTSPGRPKSKVWIIAFVSVVILLFALSFLFAKAKVTVNPKTQDVTLNQNISAVKDGSNGDATALAFNVVSISGDQSEVVEGGVAKNVAVKATGSVYIYNTTASTQNLDIDTRLSGSNGKLYKTVAATKVPPQVGSIPGKVKISIYADVAGSGGNAGLLDFKIVGFQGTSKYTKFYARSISNISGGFTGTQYQIADAQKAIVVAELKAALSKKLSQQATAQIPNGFILFKDAVFTTMDSDITTTPGAKDGEVTADIKGTLSGVLFDQKKLTTKIAKSVVTNYDGSAVHIPNIQSLIFSLNGDSASLSSATTINFNLSGPAKIVWDVDSSKVLTSLVGISKKDFNEVLSAYPNIDSANLTIRPFWVFSLPSKAKNIQIVVN